jgi:hypothetical protein
VWLFPSCCGSFSPFGCGSNRRWQFQLGLFRSAIVAMVQRLDARSFFGHPQLIRLYVFGARPQGMSESF